MTPLMAGLAGACLLLGALLVVVGLVPWPTPVSTGPSTTLWTTVDKRWKGLSRTRRLRLVAALTAGFGVFAVTGWVAALVVVPAVALGVPALLADPGNRDVDVLEALDRWVRALAASLPTGKSITDAIRSTAPQAPVLLAGPLHAVVARLDARWTTREALLAMADDLDSADADAVLAALVLAAQRGGVGATATLTELADSVQTRLRALREIEAERAKPRVVVRQVTLVSVVGLGIAVVMEPGFFAPYRHPVGQVVLLVLVVAYVAALLGMRHMTLPRRRERILQRLEVRDA